MGALMGLCPQPDEWAVVDWCKPFGLLPSRLGAEDWRWLQIAKEKEWLSGWYERWHQVATGQGSMPQDVVDTLLRLSQEAEEKWKD